MDVTSFLAFALLSGSTWLYILMVVVGLGLIIFVHELGHFLVAKACGVKCEKFYLGFDIFGLRLARFRWGETEYGIGILPLGGYVKMLGQEDNPTRLKQELERAKAVGARPDTIVGEEGITVASLQAALYDPRSYLAKSVPQRMAIISAGVAMNLLFALVVAIVAFGIGIDEFPCAVGQIAPGEGAWRAGVQPGDKIVAIGGRKTSRFQDIQQTIPLTRRGDEVRMTVERVERPDEETVVSQTLEVRIVPDRIRVIPTIGVSNAFTTELADPPCFPGSPAQSLKSELPLGWSITQINGKPVHSYADIHREWALSWGLPAEITVEPPAGSSGDCRNPQAKAGTKRVRLAPAAVRDIGLMFDWGRIVAVQTGSPAAQAGVQPGDELIAVECPPDVAWNGDLLELPYRLQESLRRGAGKELAIKLTLRRTGQDMAPSAVAAFHAAHAVAGPQGERRGPEAVVTVPARLATAYADLFTPDSPWEIPQLGLAVEIRPVVRYVEPGSPAEKAGLEPGDVVLEARTISPPVEEPGSDDSSNLLSSELDVRFDVARGESKATWPTFFREFQKFPPGTDIELTVQKKAVGGKGEAPQANEEKPKVISVRLTPRVRSDWFFPDRDLIFKPMTFRMRAASLGEAFQMGARETWVSVTLIYRILNRLGRGDVSPRALVGPIGLVQTAYRVASQGAGRFLLFLTLLSANLAVVNFLPIPVLDGGHMVFLLYEGIRGKPPSEAVYVGLSYLGLAIILGIMLWVFGLDLGFIAR